MLCQECEERPANLSYSKDVNGEKIVFHLCEQCAREKGYPIPETSNDLSKEHLSSEMMDEKSNTGSSEMDEETQQISTCEKCGLTYEEFNKIGRFGCEECYKQFAEHLQPLFRRIHVTTPTHTGKIPKRYSALIQDKHQLEQLKKQLQHFIEQEQYEQAAEVRDQIQELENKVSE